MPNKKLIQKKLAEIIKQLRHLQKLSKLKHSELFGSEQNFYFAERVMERLIGSALDINMHLAADIQSHIPDDYFESFLNLAKLKILPIAFAKKIAPSSSLRNLLVHEYQKINPTKFEQAIKYALKDYTKYAQHIQNYLESI